MTENRATPHKTPDAAQLRAQRNLKHLASSPGLLAQLQNDQTFASYNENDRLNLSQFYHGNGINIRIMDETYDRSFVYDGALPTDHAMVTNSKAPSASKTEQQPRNATNGQVSLASRRGNSDLRVQADKPLSGVGVVYDKHSPVFRPESLPITLKTKQVPKRAAQY